jgi:hypothetical protein
MEAQVRKGSANPLTALMIARASDELFIESGIEIDELHQANRKL